MLPSSLTSFWVCRGPSGSRLGVSDAVSLRSGIGSQSLPFSWCRDDIHARLTSLPGCVALCSMFLDHPSEARATRAWLQCLPGDIAEAAYQGGQTQKETYPRFWQNENGIPATSLADAICESCFARKGLAAGGGMGIVVF